MEWMSSKGVDVKYTRDASTYKVKRLEITNIRRVAYICTVWQPVSRTKSCLCCDIIRQSTVCSSDPPIRKCSFLQCFQRCQRLLCFLTCGYKLTWAWRMFAGQSRSIMTTGMRAIRWARHAVRCQRQACIVPFLFINPNSSTTLQHFNPRK